MPYVYYGHYTTNQEKTQEKKDHKEQKNYVESNQTHHDRRRH